MAVTHINKFKRWLVKHGAVLLDPTNEYELVRFKTDNGVSIIYTNSKNRPPKMVGESREAYDAFLGNRPWKSIHRDRANLSKKKAGLAVRDGRKCFACWDVLPLDKLTIEHILSFSQGGTDNDYNLCLLCGPCNGLMDNLPVVQKITLIISLRPKQIILESTPSGDNYFHKLFLKWGKKNND